MKPEAVKDAADAIAAGTAIGAWLSYLPEAAAVLTILWALIRIYEWVRFRILGKKDIKDKFL